MMFSQVRPPFNEGLYRPVRVDLGPPGTMVNAQEPAPHMNCTGGPQETICDLIRLALQAADAREGTAGWNHTWAINITGRAPGAPEPYVELVISTLIGGAGAVSGVDDGWDAVGSQAGLGGGQIGDTEITERLAPIIVHRLALARDTAIPGRWRGGCGLITEIEPIDHEMTVISWGEGGRHPAVSVDGAAAPPATLDAKVSRGWIVGADGEERHVLTRNETVVVGPGERFRNRSAGGGGAGDPLQRPPALVADDVRTRKVSREAAEAEYGVVLAPGSFEVDEAATAARRSAPR
jgi:N-methylhydantoinase B